MASGDPSWRALGIEEIDSLLERQPPITDPEVLSTIDQPYLRRAMGAHRLSAAWDRAQCLQPKNEQFLCTWLLTSLFQKDYPAAQKVSILFQAPQVVGPTLNSS